MAGKPGYIYIAKNASMPDLVKIGKTARLPEQRLRELSSPTGVPQDYDLVESFYVPDMDTAERHIHEHLRRHRPNPRREFFQMNQEDAVGFVQAYMELVQKQQDLMTFGGDVPWDDGEWIRQAERNAERQRQRRSWNQEVVAARNGDGASEASEPVPGGSRKKHAQKKANQDAALFSRSAALALALVLAVSSFAGAYYWFTQTFFQQNLPGATASRTLASRLDMPEVRVDDQREVMGHDESDRVDEETEESGNEENTEEEIETAEDSGEQEPEQLQELAEETLIAPPTDESDAVSSEDVDGSHSTETDVRIAEDSEEEDVPPEALAVEDSSPTTWGVLANSALEQAVVDSIGFSGTAEELAARLAELSTLDLSGYGLQDISGLEQFRRLQNLTLDNNSIQDLTPLQSLPLLQNLSVNHNQLQDASQLAGLRYLRGLSLRGNQVSDLSFAASLPTVTRLHIDDNPIRDLSPLLQMDRLLAVSASGTQVQSLSGVLNHPSLLEADLRSTALQSFPLEALDQNLPRLDLRNNTWQQLNDEELQRMQDHSQIRM